jgi:hypothetical protein
MSLDWKMPEECDDSLLTYKWKKDDGTEVEQMHPILHMMIWQTIMLRMNYVGNDKKKSEVFARVAYLQYRYPEMCQSVLLSGDTIQDLDTTWKGAIKTDVGYRYYIQPKDIHNYWGLWTNSSYGETFAKFVTSIDKIANKS